MQLTQVAASPEQIAQLMATPKNTPIVMTNIIKFKPLSGNGIETGKEAYMRYLKNVQPFIAKAEATIIWKGNVATTVIGDSLDQPDMILIVEYPSVAHFLQMATNPAYQKIAIDRTIALEYGGLLACKTID